VALDFTKIGQIEKTAIPGMGFLKGRVGKWLSRWMLGTPAARGASMGARVGKNAKDFILHPASLGFTGYNLASAARPSADLAGQARIFGRQGMSQIPQMRMR